MKENREENIKSLKEAKIKFTIGIILIDLITVILTYFIMPVIQNFPPLSENLEFQRLVQPLTHVQQYTVVFFIGITVHLTSFMVIMRKITRYINKYYNYKNFTDREILQVRKECQNIPYKVLIVQMSLFIVIGIIFNLIMLVKFFAILKFTLAIIAITSIVSLFTFIATKEYLNRVLLSTYDVTNIYEKNIGYRISNTKSLILQTMPFIAVILILLSLIGYSKATKQLGLASGNYYKVYLEKLDIEQSKISKEYLIEKLDEIPLNNKDDMYFIIKNDKTIYNSNEEKAINQFVIEYKNFFYDDFSEGMLYEKFGIDEQAYAIKIDDLENNNWYIGFKFNIVDDSLLLYYFMIIVILIFVYTIVLYIWAKNMSNNTKRISNALKDILNSNNINENNIIPIMSNDELGDLAYYYNKIEKKLIDQQKIIEIKSTYEGLEDSATNMAHSIKNNAGAIDGCINLLYDNDIRMDDESYKKTLDNMKVANDEVLKLVKGTMSQFLNNHNMKKGEINLNKLLENLVKLEENQIKKIGGEINVNIREEIILYGIESKLHQAINNLVQNAILTYEERNLRGNVDITVTKDKNNFINISVSDTAGGLPKKIQKGIFKEMLTTRGAKGTGLGLFFTSKNIQVDFNGTIDFDTEEGKGTTFYIKIPLNNDKKEL